MPAATRSRPTAAIAPDAPGMPKGRIAQRQPAATRTVPPERRPPASLLSLIPLVLLVSLGLLDALGQALQRLAVEHARIDQCDQHLLDRAVAEPVDDALDRARRDLRPGLGGAEHIGAAVHGVGDVPFFLEPPQHGANRGFLWLARQTLTDRLRGGRAR